MRIDGTLAKWNEARGFGFIAPREGGPEVFVHISAFPRDGRRPSLGEPLSFEIEVDAKGKKRATRLLCPSRPAAPAARRPEPRGRHARPGLLGRALWWLLLGGAAFYAYGEFSRRTPSQAVLAPQAVEPAQPSPFRCDGRTHCSEMSSCAEATFFLQSCPGVQMDGNHDGVPCEQQWCTGRQAR